MVVRSGPPAVTQAHEYVVTALAFAWGTIRGRTDRAEC